MLCFSQGHSYAKCSYVRRESSAFFSGYSVVLVDSSFILFSLFYVRNSVGLLSVLCGIRWCYGCGAVVQRAYRTS